MLVWHQKCHDWILKEYMFWGKFPQPPSADVVLVQSIFLTFLNFQLLNRCPRFFYSTCWAVVHDGEWFSSQSNIWQHLETFWLSHHWGLEPSEEGQGSILQAEESPHEKEWFGLKMSMVVSWESLLWKFARSGCLQGNWLVTRRGLLGVCHLPGNVITGQGQLSLRLATSETHSQVSQNWSNSRKLTRIGSWVNKLIFALLSATNK